MTTKQPLGQTASNHLVKYSVATRIFHWVGALLIIVAWVLIEQGDGWVDLHKSVGVSFLIWTLLRIVNRLVGSVPPAVPMPKWQTLIAHLVHWSLYVAMLAMPISGVLMSMYGGRGVSVFGLINIPALVAPNRDMARFFNDWHTGLVFYALVCLVVAHVAAALYHQFVLKDNLIARMK